MPAQQSREIATEGVFARIVDLAQVKLSDHIVATRRFYAKRHGESPGSGIYSRHDWARIGYVSGMLGGGERVLDVGVGGGQLINALAMSGAYSQVMGVDITTHSKFIRQTDAFEMRRMNVADLQFEDGSFDAVICMEVLEHVNRPTFLAGLKEIRRVCCGQLIMTVPFEEPEPLPRYHKQRFDRAAISDLWPTAVRQLLRRPGVSWALMEEHPARLAHAIHAGGVQ